MRRKSLYILAALMMAGAAIIACTSVDFADETLALQQGKTYTLSVNAAKGAETRTLKDEGSTLSATWNTDDVVEVFLGDKKVGELQPDKAEATAKLRGNVKDVQENDELTLKFGTPYNFNGQKGTLDYIDKNCNYAEAKVSVTEIVGDEVITTDAEFVYQQSITRFTFNVEVKTVYINDGNNVYTISLDEASSVIFVSLPPSEEALTYTFKAVDASGVTWVGDAPKKVKLDAGKFYTASITLKEYSMQDYERQDEQNW